MTCFTFFISITIPSDKNLARGQNGKAILFKQKYLGKEKKFMRKSEQTIYTQLKFQRDNMLQLEHRNLTHRQEKQPGSRNPRVKAHTHI